MKKLTPLKHSHGQQNFEQLPESEDTEICLKILKDTRNKDIDFKLPIQRSRLAKAIITEPRNFDSKISYNLQKVAGQIAYDELKKHAGGNAPKSLAH